jgi:NAD(P)-dependent dehydrogenase (short-subunit alcohol dehydrogenase family)
MSLYAKLKPAGSSGFGYGSTAEDVTRGLDLAGRVILITGCNSGIGLESMRVLAARGATVIGAARSLDKARAACASVTGATVPVACELAEPASVLACVAEIGARPEALDAIICNAGIMALPKRQVKHGYELQFFTNHVGHFLLVTGLLDRLAPAGRVIMLSSEAHRYAPPAGIEFDNLDGHRGYSGWRAYGQSKLSNMLFAKQLAKRFRDSARVANALHPGVIETNLARHMNPLVSVGYKIAGPLFFKSIPQGAATQVWAAVHPDTARLNGEYLADCNVARPHRHGLDEALAERLWAKSEAIAAELTRGR